MTTTTGGVAPKATSSADSSSDAANRPAIPGLSRNAAGTTTRAGERKVANRRNDARRMYAKPAAAPQPAANASGRPGCQPPSGLSAASATAPARLPTMIPAAPGRHPGASRSATQSPSAALAGPARPDQQHQSPQVGRPGVVGDEELGAAPQDVEERLRHGDAPEAGDVQRGEAPGHFHRASLTEEHRPVERQDRESAGRRGSRTHSPGRGSQEPGRSRGYRPQLISKRGHRMTGVRLQVTCNGTAFCNRSGRVVGHHPRGFPVPGEHHVRG